MSKFENVTIVKKANVYFDGKVSSRTVIFADGEKKTLGMMAAGDYTFGTNEKEIMEILDGQVAVRLPGESDWTDYGPNQTFEVPANAKFDIKVKTLTDYCCSYINE
jgi:purine/pyrimidine-nucleoside phosphorylase